jgi:hypothetical protein
VGALPAPTSTSEKHRHHRHRDGDPAVAQGDAEFGTVAAARMRVMAAPPVAAEMAVEVFKAGRDHLDILDQSPSPAIWPSRPSFRHAAQVQVDHHH